MTYIKDFTSYINKVFIRKTNERIGVISGINRINIKEVDDEMRKKRDSTVAAMRKETGSDLLGYKEDDIDITSTETEETLPTIDIDKILMDYAMNLNNDQKIEFVKKLEMHIQHLKEYD